MTFVWAAITRLARKRSDSSQVPQSNAKAGNHHRDSKERRSIRSHGDGAKAFLSGSRARVLRGADGAGEGAEREEKEMNGILAVDPGPEESAYVIWYNARAIGFGKLGNLYIRKLIAQRTDLRLAIEMVASYGMPVGREVFETCVWIGRYMEQATDPYAVHLVYRRDAKMNLCHNPKASDANVSQALRDRFGQKGTMKNPGPFYGVTKDVWQAIAVAVYVEDALSKAGGIRVAGVHSVR
jgi:hypothetical protein